MKIKRITVALLLSLSLPTYVYSIGLGKMLVMDSPKNYIGQTTDKGNAKNGLGIQNRGDAVYIGDFSSNKFHGKGILYTEEGIKDLPGATVYVGGWMKGKKHGNANCYNDFGQLIYSGRFENDKPVSQFPQSEVNTAKTFVITELSDGSYYLGEMTNSQIEGFGLVMDDDQYWIGTHKNGLKHGVGIIIYSPTDWQQVSYKGETCNLLDSSRDAAARHQQVKTVNAQVWADFTAGMEEALSILAEIGEKEEPAAPEASSTAQTQVTKKSDTPDDCYYIPRLIKDLEDGRRQIETDNRFKNTRAQLLKEWDEKIQNLVAYSKRNQTDYIPKETYKRMQKARRELAKNIREIDRKYHHELSKTRMNTVYNSYVNLLTSLCYGTHEYSITKVRDIQENMSQLRQKYGYKKSKWEDWDGKYKTPPL